MIQRNDPCWCGSGKKWKKCHFPQKDSDTSKYYLDKYGIIIKTPNQIEKIKVACTTAASILDTLCKAAKEGVTTNELDILSQKLHKQKKAIPAPLGYGQPPFPKTVCTSVNEVICHGIPNDIPLKNGDIINIDVTSIIDGFYGDCSRMVIIGKTTEEKKKVVDVSYQCLIKAIEACKIGVFLNIIGQTIEDYARSQGFSVVNQFVGHGVGIDFHEPPQVPHHYNDMTIPLVENMVFTIEPMINVGVREAVIDTNDNWTARTKDNKPSAQWEHTLLITKKGAEILTLCPN